MSFVTTDRSNCLFRKTRFSLSVKIKLHPVTCRRRAKPRQSLTLPTPDSEHTLKQLLQSLLQCHVLVHFRRALGTHGVAHHRRLSMKRTRGQREIYRSRAVSVSRVPPLLRYRRRETLPLLRARRTSGRIDGVLARSRAVVERTRGCTQKTADSRRRCLEPAASWNATRRPDPLTASQKLLLRVTAPPVPSTPVPWRAPAVRERRCASPSSSRGHKSLLP